MFRPMRRYKQQVSDEACREILRREPRGVLSLLGDEGYPYGVPLDFWYDEAHHAICFHGAKEGHKLDAMRRMDKASFCIWDQGFRKEGAWELNITSVIAFGRIEGQPVGFIANQPMVYAGCLDIDAAEKAARFVRTCDAFNIPIVMLVDVPGFLPGAGQEYGGILRRGAKLLYAYGEATVPKITVTLRKAYGGAYCVMGSKGLGADVNLAWPTAQIAVMGAAGAIGFIYRKELRQAAEKGLDVEELAKSFEREYEDQMLNPYIAAERGLIDAVILPSETRRMVARNLQLYRDKNVPRPARKHGNIPL